MRAIFVKTQNVRRLSSAIDALGDRGAGEACLMVLDGDPGLGKTETTHWIATRNDCIFVRAKKEWTPSWMINDLLKQLHIIPAHRVETKFEQLLEALGNRAAAAAHAKELFCVIIDEADYISRSDKMLSTLRDISDDLEIPIIMVGMGRLRTNLKRFPQTTSRVSQYVNFKPLTLEDTKLIITEICEVPIRDDLVERVHKLSRGYVREIKEAIAHMERFGKRLGQGIEVGIKEMEGHVLMNDRATSRPIMVRA